MDSVSRRKFLTEACAGAGLAAVAGRGSLAAAEAAPPPANKLSMPRRTLGKTGWLISIIGFGGGSQYQKQEDLAVAEQMIQRAVELGVNYFDTAYAYRDKSRKRESYRRYGKFLVPRYRKQIILTSKLMARDAETAKRHMEESLKELGTDYVDLLHFHDLRREEEVDQIVSPDGALKVYREWKEQGVIRAIGVTGHTSGDLLIEAIRRIEPDCVMCPQNPAHSGQLSGSQFAKVIPVALQRGMGMLAMKTTGRNSLMRPGEVTPVQLVRYALNLPIAAAIIGMPSLEVLESCAAIARGLQPMPEEERRNLEQKLARASTDGTLPYMAASYTDGHCECAG
jgi:predicted aldo/keto reductase-like oxidoreductase